MKKRQLDSLHPMVIDEVGTLEACVLLHVQDSTGGQGLMVVLNPEVATREDERLFEEEIARERANHSGASILLRRSVHGVRQEIIGFEDGVTDRGERFYYLRLAQRPNLRPRGGTRH